MEVPEQEQRQLCPLHMALLLCPDQRTPWGLQMNHLKREEEWN